MRLREVEEMKTWLWVVVVAVAVLVIVVFWTASYNAGLSREWNGLQQSLAELDTTISGTNCDFADIEKSANDLKSRVDSLKTRVVVSPAPPWSAKKKFYFVDFLDKTSTTLASVSVNCKTWSGAEIGKMSQAAKSMRDAQSICSMAVGMPASRADIFVATASTFNKMRQARKKASQPPPTTIVTLPAGGGFVMPTDPYLASYVSRMQSLLREYKSLRGGLDRYIDYVKRTGQSIEGSAYTVEFDRVIAARQSILDRVNMISPPIQYLSHHQEAAACIEYGISAMCALKRGDYPSFHNMSEQNTPRLARIRRIYGY